MLSALRQRVLASVLGGGLTGTLTASAGSWLFRQASDAISRQPELLDVSTLVPGETYVVSTRPAPKRRERRAAAELAATRRTVARRTAPDRSARRTRRKLTSARKRLRSARPQSKRAIKLEREVRRLDERFEELTAPSRRTRKLQRRAAALEIAVDLERSKAMTKAARRVPPARERTFR